MMFNELQRGRHTVEMVLVKPVKQVGFGSGYKIVAKTRTSENNRPSSRGSQPGGRSETGDANRSETGDANRSETGDTNSSQEEAGGQATFDFLVSQQVADQPESTGGRHLDVRHKVWSTDLLASSNRQTQVLNSSLITSVAGKESLLMTHTGIHPCYLSKGRSLMALHYSVLTL